MLQRPKARKSIATMLLISHNSTPSISANELRTTTMRIAYGLHGCDPRLLPRDDQIAALASAARYGQEEFVVTLVSLLPSDLRLPASRIWDQLA
jgi:hypothetical protein